MGQGQIIALVGGIAAVLVGLAFVVRRHWFADYYANRNPFVPRSMRGNPLPWFVAFSGGMLLVVGAALIVISTINALT